MIINSFYNKLQKLIFKPLGVFPTIMGGDSFTASLLVAKHEVDPLVKVLRHVLTLQRHPVLL